MDPAGFSIRDARDDDSLDLIGLVARCWSQHPGCVLDVHGEEPDLLAPASAFARGQGRLWVVEAGERLVGSIGVRPSQEDGDTALLLKLYVDPTVRRRGLARRLVDLVEEESARRQARRVELWSDTRFDDAHRLYEALGYERLPETRELRDLSHTVEYHYRKVLAT